MSIQYAAQTLGNLVRANPTSADIFDRQLTLAFKWLDDTSRNEYRVYMAMLIIRELAKATPTLFNEHINTFLKSFWVGITDASPLIREISKLALRQVLVLIGKKKAQNWHFRLFTKAKKTIQTKNPTHIHGAILAIGELLNQDKNEYISEKYNELCQIFFNFKDQKFPFLKESIIQLMPRLAKFNPKHFSKFYLDPCLKHIIKEHKIQSVPPQVTYTALGEVAKAVGEEIMANIPAIIKLLNDGLTPKRASPVAVEALQCIAMLAEAIGPLLRMHANDLVDKMVRNGLTSDQGEELVKALTALVDFVKDPKLLADIQKRLLAAILQILIPSAVPQGSLAKGRNRDRGVTSASATQTQQYLVPHDIGNISDVLNVLMSSTSQRPTPTTDTKADNGLIILALNTLGTFNFHNVRLLWFVCQCLVRYLDHPGVDVRKAAVVAVSSLLLRKEDPNLEANLCKQHYTAMVYQVLEQLLIVGIADPMPRIREAVILSLKPRFDRFLAQAENLHALFVALNDERFSIRAASISVIGRLALRNPAHVMPSLRKTLIQLLTELQYGGDSGSREQSCRLLGHLIDSSDRLTKPYLTAILKVLLPGLKERDHRLVSRVVETIGKLEKVGGSEMLPYLPELIKFILHNLSNKSHPIERQVLLRALGQLIRTTGCVIQPYTDYPELLPTILHVLSTEHKKGARREVIKVLGILGALDPYQHKINQAKLRHAKESEMRKEQKTSNPRIVLDTKTAANQGREKKATERAGRVSVNPTRITDDRFLLPSMVGSLDEFYSRKAMNALMRILAEPTLSAQHNSVMKSVTYVFKSLGSKCSIFLPRIIPTFLEVIKDKKDVRERHSEALQKQVFVQLGELVSIVGKDIRPYLEDILTVIYDRWGRTRSYTGPLTQEMLALIERISMALKDEFKFYLPDLIPHFLRALHNTSSAGSSSSSYEQIESVESLSGASIGLGLGLGLGGVDVTGSSSNTFSHSSHSHNENDKVMIAIRILQVIQSFGVNLEDYLHLLIPTLMRLSEMQEQDTAIEISEMAVVTMAKLCTKLDFRDYASCIVHPTARILMRAPARQRDKVMAMLCTVIQQMGVDFLLFVPLVNKVLEHLNRTSIVGKWDQKEKARLTACVEGHNLLIDIIMKGEDPTPNDLNKALGIFNAQPFISWERERKVILTMGSQSLGLSAYERKLSIDVPMVTHQLMKAWECHTKVTKEDWVQWMNNFMVKLLEYSPSTSLRPCVTLAKRNRTLARELFNAAFLSCWTELNDAMKDNLIQNLQTALRLSTPPEILQILLNLAEFMQREGRSLPILQDEYKSQPTLGHLAEHCHAYAKALHYKEIEFKTSPQESIESLISINNELQQPDAAVGILKCAQGMRGMSLQPSWYEKLQRWEDALEEYEVKQLQSPNELKITLGRMRCLDALGSWKRLSAMCEHVWATPIRTSLGENDIHSFATFGARSAWELKDWKGMQKYVQEMPDGTPDTFIFRTVLEIRAGNYESALNYIDEARQAVYPELRSLVGESYNRAYGHVVKVQLLAELEEVIRYRRTNRVDERAHMNKMWSNRILGTQRDIMVWRHLLAARKLVLEPCQQINTLVEFSALARKSNRTALSLNVLTPFLGDSNSAALNVAAARGDPRHVALPAKYPAVSLAYLVHLDDAGYSAEALHRLEGLVKDLDPAYNGNGNGHNHGENGGDNTGGSSNQNIDNSNSNSNNNNSNNSFHNGNPNGNGNGNPGDDLKIKSNSKSSSTETDIDKSSILSDSVSMANTLQQCYLKLGQWRRAMNGENTSNLEHVLVAYHRATQIRKESYEAWHAYASVHFRLVSLYDEELKQLQHGDTSLYGDEKSYTNKRERKGSSNSADSNSNSNKAAVIKKCRSAIDQHVVPAVDGFFKSISLAGTHSLQDVLRLLTLWFNQGGNEHYVVNQALSKGFNTTAIDTWLGVIPQIIARIDSPNTGVRKLVHQLLSKIGKEHPQALIYPLTVASKSQIVARQKAADHIMNYMKKNSKKLVEQAQIISGELIRVAILWHEMWHDALEEASKFWFGKRNVVGMLQVLEPLHGIMARGPQTMREVAFQQRYGRELSEAKEWCDRYKVSGNESDLNQAWDSYCNVFRRINKNLSNMVTVELEYASPLLKKAAHLELAVPGTYETGGEGGNKDVIKIACFLPRLKVIDSKQRPRKLSIMGSDGVEYAFLLKGHEDLRQDERVMQLFGLVNTLLAQDTQTTQKNLSIHRYSVIPLAPNSGLIQWLENSDTLHSLIKEYRDARSILIHVETLLMKTYSNKLYEHMTIIQKLEVFEYALSKTSGLDLCQVLWLKSQDSETWLDRRTNYTRSLGVMCMVGYILGLGDRHPCNLMLDQFSGKIIHIDFGDCFEVAMQREKFPEKIPFRLTRMLINAMEVSGIEGNFRSTCEAVMRVLRTHKESVMAVLEAFVYDPLINWRLLQTKVSRLHENPDQKDDEERRVLSEEAEGTGALQIADADGDGNEANSTEVGNPVDGHDGTRNGNGEEVKRRGGGDGAVFLNKKALTVIGRISSKLDGKDFGDAAGTGTSLNVPQQVEKLIRQATSHVNLCQCYIGWCPFW